MLAVLFQQKHAMPTSRKRHSRSKEPAPLKFPASGGLAKVFTKLVKIALKFPGVEEGRSYGTPALKVKGKFLARLRTEAEGGLAIHCDFAEREMLIQAEPGVFFITDHYKDSPMVLIDLKKVRWDAMPYLIEQAWRTVASPKLLKEFDSPK